MNDIDQFMEGLWELREKLRQAVEAEKFNDAALLRDEVRKIEDVFRKRKLGA